MHMDFHKPPLDAQEIAKAVGIRAMPTFKSFFNGVECEELVGADQAKLRAIIEA